MRLIFFGTAGAVQSEDNSNISFSIVEDQFSILIDASGNPVQFLKKAGIDPLNLDVLVLTHSHTDHIYAFPSLIHNLWLMKRKKTLNIITNPFTEEKAKGLCTVLSLLSKESLFRLNWITLEEGLFELTPELKIHIFPVEHSTPTSGFKIYSPASSLVYSCDTAPINRVIHEARSAGALIHEASGTIEEEKRLNEAGHSSGRQAGEAAENAGVETLFLCHFDYKKGSSHREVEREARSAFRKKTIVPELFTFYQV